MGHYELSIPFQLGMWMMWVKRLANKTFSGESITFEKKMLLENELVEMTYNYSILDFDGTSSKNVMSDFSY